MSSIISRDTAIDTAATTSDEGVNPPPRASIIAERTDKLFTSDDVIAVTTHPWCYEPTKTTIFNVFTSSAYRRVTVCKGVITRTRKAGIDPGMKYLQTVFITE